MYEAFVKYTYGRSHADDRHWFTYDPNLTTVLDALCEIKGINLTIKQMTQGGQLKTVHTHHTNPQNRHHILWHTSGGRDTTTGYARETGLNHFNRLYPQAERLALPDVSSSQTQVPSVSKKAQPGAVTILVKNIGKIENLIVKGGALIAEDKNGPIPITHRASKTETKSHGTGLFNPKIKAVMNLAANICFPGMGPVVMAAIDNGFDPKYFVKEITSAKFIRSQVMDLATAGIMDGIGAYFNVAMAPAQDALKRTAEVGVLKTLGEHVQAQVIRSAVRTPLEIVINQQKPREVLEQNLRNIVANSLGGFAANTICDLSTIKRAVRSEMNLSLWSAMRYIVMFFILELIVK